MDQYITIIRHVLNTYDVRTNVLLPLWKRKKKEAYRVYVSRPTIHYCQSIIVFYRYKCLGYVIKTSILYVPVIALDLRPNVSFNDNIDFSQRVFLPFFFFNVTQNNNFEMCESTTRKNRDVYTPVLRCCEGSDGEISLLFRLFRSARNCREVYRCAVVETKMKNRTRTLIPMHIFARR